MVITKSMYYCELCGNSYPKKSDAEACENQPKVMIYPKGMLHIGDSGTAYVQAVRCCADDGKHNATGNSFVCRESFPKRYIKVETWFQHLSSNLTMKNSNPDLSEEHAKVMIEFLNEANIPVTVWDGERAVPLEEYQKRNME